jgi:hypothetical protein
MFIQIFIYAPRWGKGKTRGWVASNRLRGIERNAKLGHAGPKGVVGVRWAHCPFTPIAFPYRLHDADSLLLEQLEVTSQFFL